MREDKRAVDEKRPVGLEWDIQPQAEASVLIKTGNTHVICGVSVEERPPSFLVGSGSGWITAEYGMLPCATGSRYRREIKGQSGRTMEIQRLIGRSLRMMVDLQTLGERTLRVDCDVLNADGGTRTASITGGALVVAKALKNMAADGRLAAGPKITPVAAISAGMVGEKAMLDLDYREDSRAETDANFVMAATGDFIEVQATAEGRAYSEENLVEMMALARKGCMELFTLWEK